MTPRATGQRKAPPPVPARQRVRLVEAALDEGLASLRVSHERDGAYVWVPSWWASLAPLTTKEREHVRAEIERFAQAHATRLSGG